MIEPLAGRVLGAAAEGLLPLASAVNTPRSRLVGSDRYDLGHLSNRPMYLNPRFTVIMVCLASALAGCDMLGLPNPAKEAAQAEGDAKAVGAACRHSGRSLEDCYSLYPDQARAQVFAGWKEMQDYMAAGNLTAVPPTIPRDPPKPEDSAEDEGEEDAAPVKKSRKADEEDGGNDSGKSRQANNDAH